MINEYKLNAALQILNHLRVMEQGVSGGMFESSIGEKGRKLNIDEAKTQSVALAAIREYITQEEPEAPEQPQYQYQPAQPVSLFGVLQEMRGAARGAATPKPKRNKKPNNEHTNPDGAGDKGAKE